MKSTVMETDSPGHASFNFDEYCKAGVLRADALGNRGPMRFDAAGRLAQDILDAYYRCGFYVFTGVLDQAEVEILTAEFDEILDNAPVSLDATIDRHGQPARFPGYYSMSEQKDPAQPAKVGLVSHPLMMMDSALRVYAHPDILKMVASVNGEDFVPFHESVFHKGAYEGAPTPWHQDGRTHWTEDGDSLEQPDGSGKTHGFNLSVSWSDCTPENCLWVVPGSHRRWRLADGGAFPPITEHLPDAVPMRLMPGDCGMVNRSSLHGSYPNKSPIRRVTMVIGFHKRGSAIGTETTNVHAFKRPGKPVPVKYTEESVLKRTQMIPLAIDARKQFYPEETPYSYQGSYLGSGVWDDAARADISRDGDEYWQRDITL